ncbi:tyrosine-protein phosphatase Lar-like [Sycon ciliatum]|uniref:tyrosine-protein phosphatase Lar-like n=1 Tax=Sycon ciliatum TaxID=27933 RepID=UPI0031F623E9
MSCTCSVQVLVLSTRKVLATICRGKPIPRKMAAVTRWIMGVAVCAVLLCGEATAQTHISRCPSLTPMSPTTTPVTGPPKISYVRPVPLLLSDTYFSARSCYGTGSLPMNVTWYKDGKLVWSCKGLGALLYFGRKFDFEDAGTYTCTMTNALGTDSRTVNVSFVGPPTLSTTPGRLVENSVTSRSARLQLQVPSFDGDLAIDEYIVTCVPNVTSHGLPSVLSVFSQPFGQVTGLHPATAYSCFYRVGNAMKLSEDKLAVTLVTKSEVPEPVDFGIISVAARTVNVSFRHLQFNSDQLSAYVIRVSAPACTRCQCFVQNCTLNGLVRLPVGNDSALVEVAFDNLRPATYYEFTAVAENVVGFSEVEVVRFVTTAEDLPGPPSAVQAETVSNSSVRVSWKRPLDPNGEILSYSLRGGLFSKAFTWNPSHVNVLVHQHTFTGLTDGDVFVVDIAAMNAIGSGKRIRRVVVVNASAVVPTCKLPGNARMQVQANESDPRITDTNSVVPANSPLLFACLPGYQVGGDGMRVGGVLMCGDSGSWSHTFPLCSRPAPINAASGLSTCDLEASYSSIVTAITVYAVLFILGCMGTLGYRNRGLVWRAVHRAGRRIRTLNNRLHPCSWAAKLRTPGGDGNTNGTRRTPYMLSRAYRISRTSLSSLVSRH